MSFTYLPESTTPVERALSDVRRHIQDTDAGDPIFSDAEIRGYLDDVSWAPGEGGAGGAMMAASLALSTNATKLGRVQGRTKTLGLELDGPALTKALREQADDLWERGQTLRSASAIEVEPESDFDLVDGCEDAFGGFY